jgi:Mg-chelatase subunit ChlI
MHIKLSKKNKKNKKITQNGGSGDVNMGELVYNSTKFNPDNVNHNSVPVYAKVNGKPRLVTHNEIRQTLNQVKKEVEMKRRINRKNQYRKAFKRKGGGINNRKLSKKKSSKNSKKKSSKNSKKKSSKNNKKKTHKTK